MKTQQAAEHGVRRDVMPPRFSFDGSIHFEIDFYGWHLRLTQLYQESESVEHAPRQAPLNFDSAIRSGLGDTRRVQVGVSVRF